MKKRIMIILLIFINAFIICLIALFNNYYNNINNLYNKSLKSMSENNNIIKASARHEKLLTLEDILRVSKYLLKNNGRLAMVHRTERLMEILFLMKKQNKI